MAPSSIFHEAGFSFAVHPSRLSPSKRLIQSSELQPVMAIKRNREIAICESFIGKMLVVICLICM
jgi:hypothetical protein